MKRIHRALSILLTALLCVSFLTLAVMAANWMSEGAETPALDGGEATNSDVNVETSTASDAGVSPAPETSDWLTAALILQHAVGKNVITRLNTATSDFDRDGVVGQKDAVLLLK